VSAEHSVKKKKTHHGAQSGASAKPENHATRRSHAEQPGTFLNKPAGATCTPACLSPHAIISPFYINEKTGQKFKVFYIARLNVVNHIAKTGAAIYPTA